MKADFEAIEDVLKGIKNGNLVTGNCKFDRMATSKVRGKPMAIGIIILGLVTSMCIGFPLMGLFGL